MQKHTVEFNQVAMANSEGSEAMLNRVMTKDNIGVAVVLEVHKELFGASEYARGRRVYIDDVPLSTLFLAPRLSPSTFPPRWRDRTDGEEGGHSASLSVPRG